MTKTHGKIGLVVEGGGMKCAYNAGILDAFIDEQITFDYCIGVSAGAGNLASYLAGQKERNLRFFTDHIHSSNYFGLKSLLKTGDLFGLRYIYDHSFSRYPVKHPSCRPSGGTCKPVSYTHLDVYKRQEGYVLDEAGSARLACTTYGWEYA